MKLKLFWLAYLIDSIGYGIYLVAFSWLTVKQYGPFGVAMITIGYAVPQVLLVIIGGITSDNNNKQTVYRICQSLFILSTCTLITYCMLDLPPLWFLVLYSVIGSVIAAFCSPNKTSLISDLAPNSQVASIHQLFNFATGLGIVIGSVLTSLLLPAENPYIDNQYGAIAFLAYGIGLLPVFFMIPACPIAPDKNINSPSSRLGLNGVITNIKDTIRYLVPQKNLRMIMGILFFVMVFGNPFSSLISIFAHENPVLDHSSKSFSHIYSALGAGNLLGSLMGIYVAKSDIKSASIFIYLIFGFCACALIAIKGIVFWEIILFVLFAGLFGTLCRNVLRGVIQSLCEEKMRGRVAGFTQLLVGISSISSGLVGYSIHLLGLDLNDVYLAFESVQTTMIVILGACLILALPSIFKTRISFQ